MGLPMYKDPDDEQIIEESAAKLDRAAATRRSAIRRETSVRPRDTLTTSQSLGRLIGDRRRGAFRSYARTEARIARLQAELEALRRTRPDRLNTLEQDVSRTNRNTDSQDDNDMLTDSENEHAPNVGVVEPTDIIRQHLPRPSRESNLRFEVFPSSTSRPSSPWRYQVLPRSSMPSPPYSAGSGRRDHSVPDGPLLDDSSMPALTEGFAPAQSALHNSGSAGEAREDENQLETPPPEAWESSYPPLRRVSRMSPRPLPRVDGLGDRRRSPSPSFSDSLEEDTWTTLLTEMHTERASALSSFTSTQPDTQTRSGRNSQNTSTSFGEIPLGDDTCDLDLPPGITEEHVLEMRALHRPRDPDRMTGRRGLQEHQDRIVGRVEVGMFQHILELMRAGQAIPEDLWQVIGLSPSFGRSLE